MNYRLLLIAGLVGVFGAFLGACVRESPSTRPEVIAEVLPVASQPQPDNDIYLDEGEAAAAAAVKAAEEAKAAEEEIFLEQAEKGNGGFSGPIRTDQHAQLADAIFKGLAAVQQHNASALLTNLQALAVMGATPREQTPDLIEQWQIDYALLSGKKAPLPEGPGYGPTYWRIELAPGETVRTSNEYFSDMISEVTIVPLAGEDIALTVSGRRNKSVCNVTAMTGQIKTCEWTPKFSSSFTSVITNQGKSSAVVYVIFT